MSAARVIEAHLLDASAFEGRVEMLSVESEALSDNPLGDPNVRELPVYLPPGWEESGARFPLIFVLAGYTGRGQDYVQTHPWRRGVVWNFDRAVASGDSPPSILAMPDAFTKLGGSQYVNSSAVGMYADYICKELLPLVENRYPECSGRRGVAGKSSGGFGALHLAMENPGLFHASASISGDCGFEFLFASEFLSCLRGLVRHEMDPERFLEDFYTTPDLSGDAHAVISVMAMAACYSPNLESPLGFDLPFDLETGERIPAVWERWLSFDPIVAAEPCSEALKALDHLHIECGLQDEFHLQWSARLLARKLTQLGIPHSHVEHDGTHRGIDHRFAPVLAKLAEVLG